MEKLVRVSWEDAAATPSHWQDEITVARCVSVGFLVDKNSRQIILSLTTAADGDTGGKFAIPRGCISSIQDLVVAPKKKKRSKVR